MNTRTETWTTLDLELFCDGEMPEDRRGAMSDALRADPALRRRLALVARIDSLACEALAGAPAVEKASPRPAGRIRWRAALAVAAVLAIAAPIVLWNLRGPGVPATNVPVAVVRDVEPPSIRVVWSVPFIAEPKPLPGAAPLAETLPVPALASLERALASGDADGAARLLGGAAPDVRAGAYRRLGELIRSGAVCERLLDSMEPTQQLAVCREWALDARLRPVTFARLARLATNSDLSLQYSGVIAALSEYPELRSWLRSYLGEPAVETVSRRRG